MSSVRGILNWLWQQWQLKPGKPAILSTLRIMLGLSGPLGVGFLIGHPTASAIAVMATLFVGMVDVGGAYRQKATAMIAAAIGVTVALLIANLVSDTLWLSLPVTFVVMFMAGFVSLYGRPTATVSTIVSIMFVVALARFAAFPNLSTVLEQCALCLAGGIWAIVVSLGLWVVRPYTPAMQSVTKCYSTLSQLIASVSKRPLNPEDRQEWAQQFLQTQDTVIQDLAAARNIWQSVWQRYDAANPRGNQLLMLIEDANQILNSVVALVELLAISANHPVFQQLHERFQQLLEQLATVVQTLSETSDTEKISAHLRDLERSLEALEHQRQVVRSQVINQTIVVQTDDFSDLVNLSNIVASLKALAQQVEADADIFVKMRRGERYSIAHRDTPRLILPEESSIFNRLRENLTFHSVHFRHALRLALVATIAELSAKVLQVPRGYWITLTAVVALKPDFGGTFQTTVQRVIGTIVGGIIGIALVLLIHNWVVILICLLLLIITAMLVRPLSYSLFITLLTPVVILLLNVIGTGGWRIGVLRVVDSLGGGGLALLGSYLLFPSWERQQLPAQLETTIRANLAYFQQVTASYLNTRQAPSSDAISKSRQQAALENANAAAAAQRLFNEPRHVRGEVEPVTTLIIYIRSLFSSVTTLAEHQQKFSGEYQFAELRRFTDATGQVLENLAETLLLGGTPHPLPALDTYLNAIRHQIEQLHSARMSELNVDLGTTTSTLSQAIQEQTPVSTELERIACAVKVMHSAVTRLRSSYPCTKP